MNEEQFLQLHPAKRKYVLHSIDNATLKTKTQIFMQACLSGHLSTVELLVKEGVDLNAGIYEADNTFCTPVTKAIIGGRVEILKYLKGNGASIDAKNILYLAVSLGNIEVIKYLTDEHQPFWDELCNADYSNPISGTVINWIEEQKIIKLKNKIFHQLNEVSKEKKDNTLVLTTLVNKI